jgi:hypothetical protein
MSDGQQVNYKGLFILRSITKELIERLATDHNAAAFSARTGYSQSLVANHSPNRRF